MSDTPPRPPLRERRDGELLEDLCIELRHVGVNEYDLPQGERVVPHIQEVCAIHSELESRGVNVRPRLERLSAETHWQILPLLADCLAYPQKLPYLLDPDGLRRYLRCRICDKAERHPEAKLFWFCEACMNQVLNALQKRTPIPGLVLFRTYNPENRCAHANDDTVIISDSYNDVIFGVCEKCVQDEIERQRSSP